MARSPRILAASTALSRLPAPLSELYAGLERSEERYLEIYLRLACERDRSADGAGARRRLAELAEREASLATEPDTVFRFHSGAPAGALRSSHAT